MIRFLSFRRHFSVGTLGWHTSNPVAFISLIVSTPSGISNRPWMMQWHIRFRRFTSSPTRVTSG
jgi:hypothetical protein